MKVLITGGTGYIGSHCAVELLEKNYEVILLDNLSNSYRRVCNQIQEITKKDIILIEGDITDKKILKKIFLSNKIDVVLHCAGLKAVNESIQEFEIAGKNKKYIKARVINKKNYLEIYSDNIENPVFVRYAWSDTSTASLFNSEGLPASSFSTQN